MSLENTLVRARNVLLVRALPDSMADAARSLTEHFFGEVLVDPPTLPDLTGKRVYAIGKLDGLAPAGASLVAVRGLATHVAPTLPWVGPGQVPRDVHGLGVFFPRFFETEGLYERILGEHTFQHLTESNKPSKALRRGIYLTDVARDDEDALVFRLMRCSSNLTGPTDNLRTTDREVLEALNDSLPYLFEQDVELNHVLAQLYDNHRDGSNKQKKARIGAHSDKTKDMPAHAVMAFCSFYDTEDLGRLEPSRDDPYDRVYKRSSGLTRLHFRRKKTVDEPGLVESFAITLYPDSVFLMSLSTNRLYTHEIRPSALDVERVPTRMGYVVRCSNREAVFKDGQTWITHGSELFPLQPQNADGTRELRVRYRAENNTDAEIQYERFPFSMNSGDYLRPLE